MNWYKKAKLIDNSHPTDNKNINTQCSYCQRWATHPNNEKANNDERIWKTYDQLDFEEKEEVDKTRQEINYVSHGICFICFNVMQKIKDKGLNPFNLDPKDIQLLSLGL